MGCHRWKRHHNGLSAWKERSGFIGSNLILYPFVGVGPIKFGMSLEEIVESATKVDGFPVLEYSSNIEEQTWPIFQELFRAKGLFLFFDNGCCNCIRVKRPANLYYENMNLFDATFDELVSFIDALDPTSYQPTHHKQVFSFKLGIVVSNSDNGRIIDAWSHESEYFLHCKKWFALIKSLGLPDSSRLGIEEYFFQDELELAYQYLCFDLDKLNKPLSDDQFNEIKKIGEEIMTYSNLLTIDDWEKLRRLVSS